MTDNFARLLALMGAGGSSGTTDYEALTNKPSIGGVTLIGDLTLAELGIIVDDQLNAQSTNPVQNAVLTALLNAFPYANITGKPQINGVTLTGNVTLAQLGLNALWVGTQAEYAEVASTLAEGTLVVITDDNDIDLVPTNGSLNPVTSNGIFQELKKLKVINENPENHNGIYRGKNLTNIYTVEQIYERVHDGSFDDLFLGDYITSHLNLNFYIHFTGATFEAGTTYYEMGGTVIARTWTETQDAEPQSGKVYATRISAEEDVDYMFGGFDLYLGVGTAVDNAITDHHAVMLPRKTGFNGFYKMHNTNFELTGYKGTDMHNITLPCFAEATRAALNNHVLPRVAKFTSVVNPDVASMAGAGAMGAATKTEVDTVYMSLLNEPQMFGTMILSSSWHEVGVDYNKLPVFNFVNPVELDEPSTNATWLRGVYSVVNGNELFISSAIGGSVGARGANDTAKVRPFFLFG